MAAVSNFYIDQGADFSTTLYLTDSNGDILNLTDYTALGQMRKTFGSGTVAATFTIAMSAATGQVTVTLTDVQTTAITSGRYVYDILLTDSSGDKTRILEGHATVVPSVSRA